MRDISPDHYIKLLRSYCQYVCPTPSLALGVIHIAPLSWRGSI
jgi:hypothetical protein